MNRFKGPKLNCEEEKKRWAEQRSSVEQGVHKVIECWSSILPADFTRGSEAYQVFADFVSEFPEKENSNFRVLKKMVLTFERKTMFSLPSFNGLREVGQMMSGSSEESYTLLSFSARDIAEQLALLESAIFLAIPATEFLDQQWVSKDPSEGVNIRKYIEWFNRVSNLISTQILTNGSAEGRVKLLGTAIDIATESASFNNFNAAMEILSSCANSSISRLKKTWAVRIEHKKSRPTFS